MPKTTKAHFELFKKECLYWHERLGLQRWELIVAHAYIPLPFIAKYIAIIVGVIDYLDNCGGKARAKMEQDLILEHEKEHIRQELIQHFIKIVESEVGYAR